MKGLHESGGEEGFWRWGKGFVAAKLATPIQNVMTLQRLTWQVNWLERIYFSQVMSS